MNKLQMLLSMTSDISYIFSLSWKSNELDDKQWDFLCKEMTRMSEKYQKDPYKTLFLNLIYCVEIYLEGKNVPVVIKKEGK